MKIRQKSKIKIGKEARRYLKVDNMASFDYELYDKGIEQAKELAEQKALLAITTTQAQVNYIYSVHPDARESNGRLIYLAAILIYPYSKKLHVSRVGETVTISGSFLDFSDFMRHALSLTRLGRYIRQPSISGEVIEPKRLPRKPISTKKIVAEVLENYHPARYAEGILIESVLRREAIPGVSCIYSPENQSISLTLPEDMIDSVLAHIESISRRSREYRQQHPFTESHVAISREVQEEYSRTYWAGREEDWKED